MNHRTACKTSADGRFRVSTPELTVLDLIQRESLVGGVGRVQEVLRGIWSQCAPEGFTAALDAWQNLPVGQRLGALLERDQQTALTAPVTHWLKGKSVRTVSLEGPLPAAERPAGTINANFKVWIPDTLEGANT